MLQNNLFTSLLLLSSTLMFSCGINKKSNWEKKNFGRPETTQPETEQDLPPVEIPEVKTPEEKPKTPVETEKENEPKQPEPEEEPVKTPANQLLSYYAFAGYFDFNSVRSIHRGPHPHSGVISQGGTLSSGLSQVLKYITGGEYTNELMFMRAQRNGEGRNLVQQFASTQGGDRISDFKKDDSQSGTQTLDWVLPGSALTESCPKPFLCVERLVWKPERGKEMTYCYRDSVSKKPMAIPYSPNPHFSYESFQAALGTGLNPVNPIEVVTHPGNVKCDEPAETRDVRPVTYDISLGSTVVQDRPGFFKRAVYEPLKADVAVHIAYRLYHPTLKHGYLPKKGPYIDQLVRLNSLMSYYLSSKEHVIVKIERTIQSPLKLEPSEVVRFLRETYGYVATAAYEFAFPSKNDVEGVQLVYHFEFCTHLALVEKPFNHCTGKKSE